eukprot:gene11210-4032_t
MVKAICVVSGEEVKGTISFIQEEGKPLVVEGEIKGLKEGKHGFHIHQFGDLTNGCTSSGGHFNPFGNTHGAPTDKVRHVGDFGNISANKDGVAAFKFEDSVATLFGEHTVVGRTIVVHADEDDLGKGGFEDSLKTGHAGARVACGIIGLAQSTSIFGDSVHLFGRKSDCSVPDTAVLEVPFCRKWSGNNYHSNTCSSTFQQFICKDSNCKDCKQVQRDPSCRRATKIDQRFFNHNKTKSDLATYVQIKCGGEYNGALFDNFRGTGCSGSDKYQSILFTNVCTDYSGNSVKYICKDEDVHMEIYQTGNCGGSPAMTVPMYKRGICRSTQVLLKCGKLNIPKG